ncbi:glucokinase [Thiomicrorhabdus hydrogeniphila]
MIYLAGDIGGTKALLQLVQISSSASTSNSQISQQTLSTQCLAEKRYLCNEYDSLESIIHTFLSSVPDIDWSSTEITSACFGLPGPVNSRVVELTNLPWVVNADVIQQACNIQKVTFVNDFYAAALGVNALTSEETLTLYQPENTLNNVNANRLVIGAGTGLGVAPVFFDGKNFLPQASEGGHFDFAPISETQQQLLSWLWQKWPHVSYERVLSGPGLETLYEFFFKHDLPNTYSQASSQNIHINKMAKTLNKEVGLSYRAECLNKPFTPLTASDIQALAETGDVVAQKALIELVTIYGAFIGSVALVWNANGGIYLAGGVALKILRWMKTDYFITAFLEKGRMSKVVKNMPIYLVTNEALGLKGAMQAAQKNMTK